MRIIRRGSGSVVTWRRAQMVLLSAQGMDVAAIAKVAFTSEDRVRDVIRNFNADGFGSLYPRYKGGHPPKFTLGQRREIKKIAKSKPAEHDLPFSTWSLAKLADFLVAEGVVDDISHEGVSPAASRSAAWWAWCWRSAWITRAARLGGAWTPRELRHSFVSILSAHHVRLEDISELVGTAARR